MKNCGTRNWAGKGIAFLKGITSNPYLRTGVSLSPMAAILGLIYLYSHLTKAPPHGWAVTLIVLVLVLVLVRIPRGIVYLVVTCPLIYLIGWLIFVDAQGADDLQSDRDDAAETCVTALLNGDNPWSQKSILGLRITTGPSTILVALPFVAATGKIDTLSFLGWCAFLAFIIGGDIRRRNNSYLTLCVLLLIPWFGFSHTLYWGLDEFYYAIILSPLLWIALARDRLILAGVIGAFMALCRLSYAPAVLAAGLWWLLRERRTLKQVGRIAIGGVGYAVVIIGIMWSVGGDDFTRENFWTHSGVPPLRSDHNPVVQAITLFLKPWAFGQLGGITLVLLVTTVAAIGLRRMPHPFFHITIAMFLTHTISVYPGNLHDYQLAFLIPAVYALAFASASGEWRVAGGEW